MADRACGGIGLVFADDAPGLGAPILALDGYRTPNRTAPSSSVGAISWAEARRADQ